MMKLSVVLLSTALAFTAACGKKDACSAAVSNATSLQKADMEKEMAKMSADEKKAMEGMMKKAEKKAEKANSVMTKTCKDDKWSDEVTGCMKDAKDEAGFKTCMEKLTPEQMSSMMKGMMDDEDMKEMKKDSAPKPAEGSAAAAPAAGSADGSAAAAAPAAAGDMPQECADYKAAIEKLASCDKLPQASRDAMKQGFDGMAATFATAKDMPAEGKKALADGCKAGADGIMQTAKAVCGW